ncbi:hypothetical protein [Cryobacterium sp. BB736]|uniref:hypothetical protein n=1 Tax=Cryobacterium sp. BB736 TaxID=2746963 RepID=UPI0018761405|nr:hypothetical protein [Cryobacterium sp. BB736]
MEQIFGAVVSILAVLAVSAVEWVSRRATGEGRRLLKVERLANVYALMPESAEKRTFGTHVLAATRELNEWMDLDSKKRRTLIRSLSAVTLALGVGVAIPVSLLPIFTEVIWLSYALGTVIGIVIVLIRFFIPYVLEKRALQAAEATRLATEQEEGRCAPRGLSGGQDIFGPCGFCLGRV